MATLPSARMVREPPPTCTRSYFTHLVGDFPAELGSSRAPDVCSFKAARSLLIGNGQERSDAFLVFAGLTVSGGPPIIQIVPADVSVRVFSASACPVQCLPQEGL